MVFVSYYDKFFCTQIDIFLISSDNQIFAFYDFLNFFFPYAKSMPFYDFLNFYFTFLNNVLKAVYLNNISIFCYAEINFR